MWGSSTAKSSSPVDKVNGNVEVLVDYRNIDYRGFLFVVHDIHGLMLLRCTRKKSKGPHWQVPGGHVDEAEFLAAGTKIEFFPPELVFTSFNAPISTLRTEAKEFNDRSSQLQHACKAGAARELFEETGIDLRASLDRIIPASLRLSNEVIKGREVMLNELKNRLFFFVSVNDSDFPSVGIGPTGREGSHLRVS
jgi:8-oxo-dGTP pyrophosphatase MutT (NUDIX family)